MADLTIKSLIDDRVLFFHKELACRSHDPKAMQGAIPEITRLRFSMFRDCLDESIVPNSVCRSGQHNRSLNGAAAKSNHIFDEPVWRNDGCIAMDIRTRNREPEYKDRLVELAWKMGFSVGIYNTFVHIDDRTFTDGRRQSFWYGRSFSGKRYDDLFSAWGRLRD